jgi:hypothetical protein
MRRIIPWLVVGLVTGAVAAGGGFAAERSVRLSDRVENLLVRAKIMPDRNKALYDASALSAIISMRLDLGWIKQVEQVDVAGPEQDYAWTRSEDPAAVRVIREIDQRAMQQDLFGTMQGNPTRLIGVAER